MKTMIKKEFSPEQR